MLSLKSEFRFVERGFKETIVLIPGWATDYRIFQTLDLSYNYLLAARLYPFNFNQILLEQLDGQRLSKVSIFGFSLGGFLASEFAEKYPQRLDKLMLVSVRKGYAPEKLKDIKQQLKKNREVYLYKFYISCFSRGDSEGMNWFKQYLLRRYLDNLSLKELIWGLDYLANHRIEAETLAGIGKMRIFHGTDDIIAPLDEALEIKSKLPQAEFVYLQGLGHIPFLNPLFKERFYTFAA